MKIILGGLGFMNPSLSTDPFWSVYYKAQKRQVKSRLLKLMIMPSSVGFFRINVRYNLYKEYSETPANLLLKHLEWSVTKHSEVEIFYLALEACEMMCDIFIWSQIANKSGTMSSDCSAASCTWEQYLQSCALFYFSYNLVYLYAGNGMFWWALTKTPDAPSARALKTSVPRRIPPSRNTGTWPPTAFTTCSISFWNFEGFKSLIPEILIGFQDQIWILSQCQIS